MNTSANSMTPEQHKKAKVIFAKARELPKGEHRGFVYKMAQNDAEVAEEVMQLLAFDFEDTILLKSNSTPTKTVIDPLGLNDLKSTNGFVPGVLFSSKGRAGFVFLIIAAIISFAGYVAAAKTKNMLADIRGEETSAVLKSNVQSLEFWISNYHRSTQLAVSNPDVVSKIVALANGEIDSALALEIDAQLQPYLNHANAYQYVITNLAGVIICSPKLVLLGNTVDSRFGDKIYAAANGEAQFFLPFYQQKDNPEATWRSLKPLVWMQIPVRDSSGKVIATFGIGRQADQEFTRILRMARMGQSGETYAINSEGYFISESRFEDELREMGCLDSDTTKTSILSLRATQHRAGDTTTIRPLTELASVLISSASIDTIDIQGKITEPTQDYKGKQVIGSWAWLPKYHFGLISQIEAEEAFAPIKYMQILIVVVVVLLVAAALFSFYNALKLYNIQGAINTAAQLGQYTLKNIIEEGGMGTVYYAQHTLLKRPTAIKVVRVDKAEKRMAKKFETEAKLASQLSHPNTIEILDYGFTRHGQAYFAMEFLDGVNLAQVVKEQGPQPPARVVHIMRQICGSLHEAHTMGLVHRDIKPQNVMLCKRIGLPDFVKVLDFGLAKPLGKDTHPDETKAITGTPVYIAPERLKKPSIADPSADIYATGALMYYLLAGKPMFDYASDLDILYQILNDSPKPLPDSVPQPLQRLTFYCIEKDPANRPAEILEMKHLLDQLASDFEWTDADAEKWAIRI